MFVHAIGTVSQDKLVHTIQNPKLKLSQKNEAVHTPKTYWLQVMEMVANANNWEVTSMSSNQGRLFRLKIINTVTPQAGQYGVYNARVQ